MPTDSNGVGGYEWNMPAGQQMDSTGVPVWTNNSNTSNFQYDRVEMLEQRIQELERLVEIQRRALYDTMEMAHPHLRTEHPEVELAGPGAWQVNAMRLDPPVSKYELDFREAVLIVEEYDMIWKKDGKPRTILPGMEEKK